MGGIVAAVGICDEYELVQMIQSLTGQGPGGWGHAWWPKSAAGLGSRRLAILDPSSRGNQPMPDDRRDLWITYNGELYNFKTLRRELERAGHRFTSDTDTEVVLKAYQEWGSQCLDRFDGMFVFVIWDTRRRELFAARDHLGEKSLYYYETGEGLLLASEFRPFYRLPSFEPCVDREALSSTVSLSWIPHPRTGLEGLVSLPPGHWLRFHAGRLELQRYWEPGVDPYRTWFPVARHREIARRG